MNQSASRKTSQRSRAKQLSQPIIEVPELQLAQHGSEDRVEDLQRRNLLQPITPSQVKSNSRQLIVPPSNLKTRNSFHNQQKSISNINTSQSIYQAERRKDVRFQNVDKPNFQRNSSVDSNVKTNSPPGRRMFKTYSGSANSDRNKPLGNDSKDSIGLSLTNENMQASQPVFTINIQNEEQDLSEEDQMVKLVIDPTIDRIHSVSPKIASSGASFSRSNTVRQRTNKTSKMSQTSKLMKRQETMVASSINLAAPCDELLPVWTVFEEQHRQSMKIPKVILKLQALPNLAKLTMLQLEGQSIKKVFELLRPCQNLQALFLGNNRIITRDLHYVKFLSRLRKLDLSANEISFLPESNVLKSLTRLEFLLLHQNQLVGFRQIDNFSGLTNLKHLTLHGNPCAKTTGFRKHLIDMLPNLYCLDEFIVFDFERKDFEELYPKESFRGERRAKLKRFQPYSYGATSWKGFGPPHNISDGFEGSDTSDSGRFLENLSQGKLKKRMTLDYNPDFIRKAIHDEHYALRRKFEWCSPGLTIAKTVKMFLTRKKYKRKRRMMKLLYFMLGRWRKRMLFQRLKRSLGLQDNSRLRRLGKIRYIQKWWKNHLRVQRCRLFVALRLQSNYRMIRDQKRSLVMILGLRQAERTSQKRKLVRQSTIQGEKAKKVFVRQNTFKMPPQLADQLSPRNLMGPISQQDSNSKNSGAKISDQLGDNKTPMLLFSRKQLEICEKIGIAKLFTSIEQSNDYVLKVDESRQSQIEHRKSLLLSMIKVVNRMVGIVDIRNKRNRESIRLVKSPNSSNLKSDTNTISPSIAAAQSQGSGQSVKRKLARQMTREGGFQFRRMVRLDTIDDVPEKLNIVPTVTCLKPSAPRTKAIKNSARKSIPKQSTKSIEGFSDHASQIAQSVSRPLRRQGQSSKVNPNNALIECTFDNDQTLTQVLRRIMTYNRRSKTAPLFVFFEPWLVRYWARVKIQRWFRGVIFRHKQVRLFQEGTLKLLPGVNPFSSTIKNTMYAHYALMSRAVMKIQRSFRNWRFRARILALQHISNYASKIDTNVLYLEETIYTNLGEIEKRSMRVKTDIKGTLSTFVERNFQYRLDEREFFVTASFLPGQDPTGRYNNHFLPVWFNRKVKCSIPSLVKAFISVKQKSKKEWFQKKQTLKQLPKTDMHSLIHLHPFTATSQRVPCVQSLEQILGDNLRVENMRFVKILHASVSEAKNRAVLIALRTCNYLRSFSSFVRMFTEEQLIDQRLMATQIKSLLAFYRIPESFDYSSLNPEAELQSHNGIIMKREDPYRTILRARPRQLKNQQYQRFIVLENSDKAEVERRIGEALMGNKRKEYSRQRQATLKFLPIRIKDVGQEEVKTSTAQTQQLTHKLSFYSNETKGKALESELAQEERASQGTISPRIQIDKGGTPSNKSISIKVNKQSDGRTKGFRTVGQSSIGGESLDGRPTKSPVTNSIPTIREVHEETERISIKVSGGQSRTLPKGLHKFKSTGIRMSPSLKTSRDYLHDIVSKGSSSLFSTNSRIFMPDQLPEREKPKNESKNADRLKNLVQKVDSYNKKLQRTTTKDPLFMNIYMQQLMPNLTAEPAKTEIRVQNFESKVGQNARIVRIPEQLLETNELKDGKEVKGRFEQAQNFLQRQKQAFSQAHHIQKNHLKNNQEQDSKKTLKDANQAINRSAFKVDERDHRSELAMQDLTKRKQLNTQTLLMNENEQLTSVDNQSKGFHFVRKIRVSSRDKIQTKQELGKTSAPVTERNSQQFKFHEPNFATMNIRHINRFKPASGKTPTSHLLTIQNFNPQHSKPSLQFKKQSVEKPLSLLQSVKDSVLKPNDSQQKLSLTSQNQSKQRNSMAHTQSIRSEAKLFQNSQPVYLNIGLQSDFPFFEDVDTLGSNHQQSLDTKTQSLKKEINFWTLKPEISPVRQRLIQQSAKSAQPKSVGEDQLRLSMPVLAMPIYSRTLQKMAHQDPLDQLKSLRSIISEQSGVESGRGQSLDQRPRFSPGKSRYSNSVEFENCRIQTLCSLPEPNSSDFVVRWSHLISPEKPEPSRIEQELRKKNIVRLNIFSQPKIQKSPQVIKVAGRYQQGSFGETKVLRSNHFVLHKLLHNPNVNMKSNEKQYSTHNKYQIAHLNLKTPPQGLAHLNQTARQSMQLFNGRPSKVTKVSTLTPPQKALTYASARELPLKLDAGRGLQITSKRLN